MQWLGAQSPSPQKASPSKHWGGGGPAASPFGSPVAPIGLPPMTRPAPEQALHARTPPYSAAAVRALSVPPPPAYSASAPWAQPSSSPLPASSSQPIRPQGSQFTEAWGASR